MSLTQTDHARTTASAAAAVVLLLLGGATQASARGNPAAAHPPQMVATKDRAKPSVGCDSTLLATWGTVTNGNSSTNAAEYRRELTGGHAGSVNAAEAPAYCAYGR